MTDVDKGRGSSDRTESKVREWALKRNGDPVTPHDVIELVLAVDDDSCERSNRIEDKLDRHIDNDSAALQKIVTHLDSETEEIKADMLQHKQWTDREPLPRIAKLEQRVNLLFAPRRATDPAATDFTEKRSDLICASSEELLDGKHIERRMGASAPQTSATSVGNVFAREIQDMTTTWRVVRWLVVIAAGAMIVWGMTYWADSCASQQAEKNADHVDVPVTPSPSSSSSIIQ